MPALRILAFTITLVLIFTSCNSEKGFIPDEKFAEILADMNLYDAMHENSQLRQSELKDMDSTYIYSYLFEKHNVTKHQFDTSLYYYAQQPARLLKITEKAYTLLEVQSENHRKETEALRNVKWLWRNDNSTTEFISGKVGPRKEIFKVPIDTTGKFLVQINLRFHSNDESIRPYILSYFTQDTATSDSSKILFPQIPVFRSKYARTYKLVAELADTNYKYIVIHVLEAMNSDSVYYRNLNISKVEVGLIQQEEEKPNEDIETNSEAKKE